MEIALIVVGVTVLMAVVAYTHHTRKGQALVSSHRVDSDMTEAGAHGPSSIDRDRGEFPVHDHGTR